jgi:hypothetical protein
VSEIKVPTSVILPEGFVTEDDLQSNETLKRIVEMADLDIELYKGETLFIAQHPFDRYDFTEVL